MFNPSLDFIAFVEGNAIGIRDNAVLESFCLWRHTRLMKLKVNTSVEEWTCNGKRSRLFDCRQRARARQCIRLAGKYQEDKEAE